MQNYSFVFSVFSKIDFSLFGAVTDCLFLVCLLTRAANSNIFNRVQVRVRIHKKIASPSSSSSSLNLNFLSSSLSSQIIVEKIQSE